MATSTTNNMGSIQSVNIDAMLRYTFVPDYSVRAVTEVMYLRVKRSFYMAAKRATLMERSKKMSNAGEFDEEVDKVRSNRDLRSKSFTAFCPCFPRVFSRLRWPRPHKLFYRSPQSLFITTVYINVIPFLSNSHLIDHKSHIDSV